MPQAVVGLRLIGCVHQRVERGDAGRRHLHQRNRRLAFGDEQEEAAVLIDELQVRDAFRGAPVDPEIAILERVTIRTPDQQRDGVSVTLDDLTEKIADGPADAEVMLAGQLGIEGRDFMGLGDADAERRGGGEFGGVGSFHPSGGSQNRDWG